MAKWTAGSETGILRKPVSEKHEDLLVFGYACKIFRDDDKALYIDQGKHLIPWMGNNTLKIDRYDCRGALSELGPYEGTDHDSSRLFDLNESERRIEMLCDQERYYALKHNEEELEMYQEEEEKRLLQKRSEIQYNYDVPVNPEQSEDTVEEQDEAFVRPPELNVPADMEVPKTVKENARIEKTATFVSSQGPQMEILIKTKQADNPQFNFMNKDHPLYKYYKFVLTAIKSGQYKVQSETSTSEQKADDTNEQEEPEGHYLHPSLVATSVQSAQPPPPPLPTVIYKPSADCAYSQLVSRIQGTQSESATPPLPPQEASSQGQMTYEQQQYYQQYYYAAQYYEYYKQVAHQYTGQNSTQSPANAVPEGGFNAEQFYSLCQNQMEFQNVMQTQAAFQQYSQQQSSNPYAQLVSNLSQTQSKEAYSSTSPSLVDISKAPILYTNSEPEPEVAPLVGPVLPPTVTQVPVEETKVETTIKMPLLSLAQYGSDSEEEDNHDETTDIKIPPHDLQQIIDKMAIYVSKNGKDFENIVRGKGDSRFHFLNDGHEYNPYYKMKIGENADNDVQKQQQNGITDKPKEKKVVAPVSFSIKKAKDDIQKEIKSALPVEESEDEHENEVAPKSPPVVVSVPTPTTPPEIQQLGSLTPPPKETPTPDKNNSKDEDITPQEIPEIVSTDIPVDTEDLILEMIDITEDSEEHHEHKKSESTKKDKMTAAARERLALQLERKKKAAAFLKLKTTSEIDVSTIKNSLIEKVKESRTTKSNKHKVKSKSKQDDSHISGKLNQINKDSTKSHKSRSRKDTPNLLNKPSKLEPKEEIQIPKENIVAIINIEDSDLEEGEIKKHKKSAKKKKSHKRKRSKSRHESKNRHKHKEHKKSKKHKKSKTRDSDSSVSS